MALVGASGSGKSTVSLLLPRFYDVQEGHVRVDGIDVRDVTLESLRRNIGVVFEDSFLFSDCVRNNIAYGRPDATDEEVEAAAARAAGAHEFIGALPDGYDTIVGERGLTLSGGQRQRVAIARALLTDPAVLILDDATSSVDARTEEQIHATLREVMAGRTTIVVAHRRSTLRLAERIVLVDGGRIVNEGSHEELLATSALYRDLLVGPRRGDRGPGAGLGDGGERGHGCERARARRRRHALLVATRRRGRGPAPGRHRRPREPHRAAGWRRGRGRTTGRDGAERHAGADGGRRAAPPGRLRAARSTSWPRPAPTTTSRCGASSAPTGARSASGSASS